MNKTYITFIYLLLILGTVNNVFAIEDTVSLKITTWNVTWLSCGDYAPDDDNLQIKNVAKVIRELDSDLVALQEIGTSNSYSTIDSIISLLGSDWDGDIVPWSYSNCAQNQGIIFKKSKMQLINSSLLNSGINSQGNTYRYNWSSGRYPALYNMNVLVGSEKIPISFINIHAKAMGDETSYVRRKGGSEGLKTILDTPNYNTKKIVLLGDFNDYLYGTQCRSCTGSPYSNFMDDAYNYKGLTAALYDPAYNSYVIDNIIISNELFDEYKPASASRETTVTQTIPNFRYTTSDHTPISALFNIVSESSDVPNSSEFSIQIYPNPSNGKFTVSYGQYSENDLIEVYTLTGVLVDTVEAQSATVEIDLSNTPNGCYILKIKGKAVKIIKR